MRFSTILLAATSFDAISGHTLFSTLIIDDKSEVDAACIRMPMDGATSTSPIIDLSSNDMACNVDGGTGVARVCPAKQGSKLSFVWRWTPNEPDLGSIDISHKGPCAVYMKKVDSAIKDPGHGDGWFKIYDFSHDENNKWCTEHLIEAKGLLSVNIPKDLDGGYYLVRPELLSLHQAYQSPENPSQPQFYTGCAQIFLVSPATGKPETTVSIPGYVKSSEPSMTFNIYSDDSYPYPMHGPSVSNITASNSRVRVKSRQSIGPQTEGLKPANCVDENGNWCGIELDAYNDMDGCLAQGKNCWEQLNTCYEGAPPTGFKGCSAWEDKCSDMTDKCNAGNFVGPPNPGKIITPPKHEYDLSIAIGMPGAKAVVPGAAPSQSASSLAAVPSIVASSSAALASVIVSSAVASVPSMASSSTTNKPATTTKASSPGSVNDNPDVDIVYVTQTVTINVAATSPCPTKAATNAKRQTFSFKPADPVSPAASSAPSLDESPSRAILFGESIPQEQAASVEAAPISSAPAAPVIPLAPGLPVIPEAPVAPLPADGDPVFHFKESTGSPNSISVETRPVIPTTDGSCGLVAGMRCEYDSILGTIAGCCSRWGYCGHSVDHCGVGCQVGYGRCEGVPYNMVKRFDAEDGLRTVRRKRDKVVATVTLTPTCGATEPPSVAHLPDIAQRLRARDPFHVGCHTFTVTAPTCTPSTKRLSSSHIHRHHFPHRH